MKKLTFERDFNEVNFYMTAQLPEQLINNHPTVDFGEHKSREVAGAINNKVRWHKGLFGKIKGSRFDLIALKKGSRFYLIAF